MSSAPYICYRELLAPSSINNCVFLHLCTNPSTKSYSDFLVSSSSNVISIYRVHQSSIKLVNITFYYFYLSPYIPQFITICI